MMYRFTPRWQYLDRDDLLHLFCLFTIRISGAQMQDAEFPPRLKRQFVRKRNGWFFEGKVDNLEFDDIGYLSKFLKISIPADVVEAPSFSTRIRSHLVASDKKLAYDWVPDVRRLDCDDVPHVLPWFEFTIGQERFETGAFPVRLRSHFQAAGQAAA